FSDLVAVVFALSWLGGGVVIFLARHDKAGPRRGSLMPGEMITFGLFFGVGGYITSTALIGNPPHSAPPWCAVTTDPLLILTGRRGQNFTSLRRDAIHLIELKEHRDGTGTLTFNPLTPSQRNRKGQAPAPSFDRIENAEEVKYLILPSG